MSNLKAKSFSSQVYSLSCSKLNLKRREKIVFFRLLGFLIRNDKPFPYSTQSLADRTGYARSSIFESINLLEHLRLIERIGCTNQVKFQKGRILTRICSLVQNRIKVAQYKSSTLVQNCTYTNLYKNPTLVQKLDELAPTSPETGYKRTYNLEHKHKPHDPQYQEYVGRIKADIQLGLKREDYPILTFAEFTN